MTPLNRSYARYPLGRFQWVTYRAPSDWCWGLYRFSGGMAKVYRWSFSLGPIELRHWTPMP